MREVERELAVPAARAWQLLTDTDAWPRWGPTVTDATVDGPFVDGTTGTVRTLLGVPLPFVLVDVEPGRAWSWRVAGVRATTHVVEPLGADRCLVTFGVPSWAAPYTAVCRTGLRRLAAIA